MFDHHWGFTSIYGSLSYPFRFGRSTLKKMDVSRKCNLYTFLRELKFLKILILIYFLILKGVKYFIIFIDKILVKLVKKKDLYIEGLFYI